MSFQSSLFGDAPTIETYPSALSIPGIRYIDDLLTSDQQRFVLAEIDSRDWQLDLKRRVQHYGYKYDYKARSISASMYVGEVPGFALDVARKMSALGLIGETPDQVIVNEYQPGQGISAHIDCEPCFKETIVTVSLGSRYVMDFINSETKEVRSLALAPGSALILRGDARHVWLHRIMPRLSDFGVSRGRRVSLTFRNVNLEGDSPSRHASRRT